MHSINNYIDKKKYGSPDKIRYNHHKKFDFEDDNAIAFIYCIKTNKILWSSPGGIHNDILFYLDDDIKEENGLGDAMFIDELYDMEDVAKSGRIWVIKSKTSKTREYDVYIAWWNELTSKEFNEYNKKIINEYNNEFNVKFDSAMVVDNNGDFVLFENDEYIEISPRNDGRNADIEVLKEIHLATNSEKRKYLKKFLKNRNERFQTKYYNTTKSKTAAEYNYIKRIGESEEEIKDNYSMKTLLDYILEQQSITFSGTGSKTENYGQCIVLAGGPGSGKGFIQNKILCNFKVYNVDDMKKQYVKLVEAGKIKDDYKYDWGKPSDVSKLHEIVKERGWKNTQREIFWNQRKSAKYVQADAHSSGLLPNILFDMVSGKIEDVFKVVAPAKAMGYKVTVIWVLCNKEIAEIGNKIRPRRVDQKIIDDGHNNAYKTMTSLFNNEHDELNEMIDRAWIGYSAGYGRKLSDKYAKNPVFKVKDNDEAKFSYDKERVNEFLKSKMPIDYPRIEKDLNSDNPNKVKTAKKWIEVVGDEYQPNEVKESNYDDYEEMIIQYWKNELSELL